MSNELPTPRQDGHADEPAIVEWGDPEPTDRRRVRFLTGLRLDRRLAPIVAGLGAVAGYASLVGEWTITTLPGSRANDGGDGVRMTAGVTDVGGFGVAYLLGLVCLVAVLALVFFGTPAAVRHNARVVGLAMAAALVVALLAATSSLRDTPYLRFVYSPRNDLPVEYGRGFVTAFLATALFGLALYLAGRPIPRAAGERPEGAAGPAADADGGGWPWRRRDAAPEPEPDDGLPPPDDLTVAPAAPFAPFARLDQDESPGR